MLDRRGRLRRLPKPGTGWHQNMVSHPKSQRVSVAMRNLAIDNVDRLRAAIAYTELLFRLAMCQVGLLPRDAQTVTGVNGGAKSPGFLLFKRLRRSGQVRHRLADWAVR